MAFDLTKPYVARYFLESLFDLTGTTPDTGRPISRVLTDNRLLYTEKSSATYTEFEFENNSGSSIVVDGIFLANVYSSVDSTISFSADFSAGSSYNAFGYDADTGQGGIILPSPETIPVGENVTITIYSSPAGKISCGLIKIFKEENCKIMPFILPDISKTEYGLNETSETESSFNVKETENYLSEVTLGYQFSKYDVSEEFEWSIKKGRDMRVPKLWLPNINTSKLIAKVGVWGTLLSGRNKTYGQIEDRISGGFVVKEL